MTLNLDCELASFFEERHKDFYVVFRVGLLKYLSSKARHKIANGCFGQMTIDLKEIREEIISSLAVSMNKRFKSASGKFYFDKYLDCQKAQRKQWLKILRDLQKDGWLKIVSSNSWHEHTIKMLETIETWS